MIIWLKDNGTYLTRVTITTNVICSLLITQVKVSIILTLKVLIRKFSRLTTDLRKAYHMVVSSEWKVFSAESRHFAPFVECSPIDFTVNF